MSKTVIVTGGTGFIGRELCKILLEAGWQVHCLSRSAKPHPVPGVRMFVWDAMRKQVDVAAFAGATALVHLAGEGIADKRWTNHRKKAIYESRTHSTLFLKEALAQHGQAISTIVSASAIGYYGYGTKVFDEESKPAATFPAKVCVAWEEAAHEMAGPGRRLVIFRIGIVLSRDGGAYPKLAAPIRYGVGTWLGSGDQVMSWIHLRDIAGMMLFALESPGMQGVYNGVAEEPVSQKFFLKQVGRYLHMPVWPVGVPSLLLQMALGERAELVLEGAAVISRRILPAGYVYKYPYLYEALNELARAAGKPRRRPAPKK